MVVFRILIVIDTSNQKNEKNYVGLEPASTA